MTCNYCDAQVPEDEHRCHRCGRRQGPLTARSGPVPYPVSRSSPARQLSVRPIPEPPAARTERAEPAARAPRQASLFPEPVIRFADINTGRKPRRQSPGGAGARGAQRRPRSHTVVSAQRSFEFPLPALPESQAAESGVEPAKCCEHPVALPVHRVMAAGLDLSMVIIALGVFVALFQLADARIIFNSITIPIYVAAALAIAGFYKLLWWLPGADSPGMRWSRLRLLNFDGLPPTRKQRTYRLAGACLSLAAAGLGLIWALADEEKLTWHDHISKTFPSPRM